MVYSIQPRGPLNLIVLPSKTRVHGKASDFVTGLQDVHRAVFDNLTSANSRYKQKADQKCRHLEFDVGDFVWAVLTKDRFPAGEYNKLSAKKIGPLEVLEKINPNAYCLKLPSHLRTADVFNVKHLIPFTDDSSDDADSRANPVQPGENDVDEIAIRFMEHCDNLR